MATVAKLPFFYNVYSHFFFTVCAHIKIENGFERVCLRHEHIRLLPQIGPRTKHRGPSTEDPAPTTAVSDHIASWLLAQMLMALFTHATGSMILDTAEREEANQRNSSPPLAAFNKSPNGEKHLQTYSNLSLETGHSRVFGKLYPGVSAH